MMRLICIDEPPCPHTLVIFEPSLAYFIFHQDSFEILSQLSLIELS